MTLLKNIEKSNGDEKYYIRESSDVVSTKFS